MILLLSSLLSQQTKSQESTLDTASDNRLSAIKIILKQDANRAAAWWWGWLGGYSAATIGQVVVGISSDKPGTRQDMFLGAATTFIGAAGQFFTPVMPSESSAQLELLPETTQWERRQKVFVAEELLQNRALSEINGRSWKMHALSGTVNLGSGLITWFGFKRTWKDGLLNFALNTAITEAQIWSQPVLAKNYYNKYMRKSNPLNVASFDHRPDFKIVVKASPNFVGINVLF